MRLVLATHNPHKVRELGPLLAPHEVVALSDDVVLPPETGSSFAENAMTKARTAAAASGAAAIADDSGIEAEALDGAPGIYSARYAGPGASDEENLAKLRREAPPGSGLAYVCALAFVDPSDGTELMFHGRCTGRMSADERGAGGFGYDPVFVPDDDVAGGRTMAELSQGEKDAISHRGRAARELLAWLAAGAPRA